jgi:hypothetical protein
MTCIVGLVAPDRSVWMGADSAATNSSSQQTLRADSKLFRLGPMLVACTSSYRMIQLLRYHLVLPDYHSTHGSREQEEDDPLFRYMATAFIDTVRHCLQEGGYARKENEREEGGTFLVGFHGRLFRIESDYQVEETLSGYNAAGSADDLALGALFATQALDLAPEARLRLVLEAAAYHNCDVRAPFVVMRLDPNAGGEEAHPTTEVIYDR